MKGVVPMKVFRIFQTCAILFVSMLICDLSQAQQPVAPAAAVDPATMIRIKKFAGVGRQTVAKTPVYDTSAPRSVTKEKEWAQIWVEYETAPEWIDEIVFSYHVLAKRVEKGKELFSLYRKVVKYADVQKGRSHFSTVFIRPNALERYGEVVASAVEITIDGKLAGGKSETSMTMPADWWKNPAVTESAAVTVRPGYLLNRSETPFAFVNVDDYEVIK